MRRLHFQRLRSIRSREFQELPKSLVLRFHLMLNQFQSTMPQVKEQMKAAGKDPVLLVPPQLRPLLARYARLFAPGLHVLSYNEVPDELELKIMGALS